MLRQALDAAASQEQQQAPDSRRSSPVTSSEVDSLLSPHASGELQNYGGDDSYRSESYAEEYSLDNSEDEEGARTLPEPSIPQRIWIKLKNFFFLVVDVDNLWDSPTQSNQHSTISLRNKYIVLFWFFLLALSYATERYTFKLIVDRTGPFRLFAVEVVTLSHAAMVGFGMFISCVSRRDFSMQPLGIPVVDVGCTFFFVMS